ncbi:MAG: cupin superfamily acireductone dioxygenase involved in methionine salvage [Gammaproteobacteria bacterium]
MISRVNYFGAGVDYPAHQHQSEGIYIALAGSAYFQLGNDAVPEKLVIGDVIHVPPMLMHGFRMKEEILIVFHL